MKQLLTTLVLAASLGQPALAQPKAVDPGARRPVATAPAADLTEGEIRKVDLAQKKLTIKHGEIRHLDMPAMTMVFQVKDAALLEPLKAGDKIRFAVEKTGDGFVVTEVRPASVPP